LLIFTMSSRYGIAFLMLALSVTSSFAEAPVSERTAVKVQTLLQTSSSWDGVGYAGYPDGKPQLSVLRITIPPQTALAWHTHPMPNAAYVLSGEIRVEKKDGGEVKRVREGEVLAEMVNAEHRGITGDKPAVLIVFYAGAEGLPLSEPGK
jgi:quercetin dioxygenase-like cupin family protein